MRKKFVVQFENDFIDSVFDEAHQNCYDGIIDDMAESLGRFILKNMAGHAYTAPSSALAMNADTITQTLTFADATND